ncbi:MAG: helix-hairpin-helix domain-containing protein [Bacillota bacterium]
MYNQKKENILITVLSIIVVVAMGLLTYQKFISQEDNGVELETDSKVEAEQRTKQASRTQQEPETILIHLAGEVVEPGVYQVKESSRLYKVVKKAGGPTNRADLNAINLANKVRDGQKIIIPSSATTRSVANKSAKININSAKQSELEEIAGVGPVTAEKIIEYRKEEGSFASVDSLTEVSGIGPKTLEKIEDEITY